MKKNSFITILMSIFIMISCQYRISDLGSGFRLDSDGKYSSQIVDSKNTVVVGSHVLEYAFNADYIIAVQRPWNDPSILGIEKMTYSNRRAEFKRSTFFQYWIIDKTCRNKYIGNIEEKGVKRALYSSVYGPFNEEEYLNKREEMKIPKTLKLKTP